MMTDIPTQAGGPGLHIRWHRLTWHVVFGLLVGFLLLHPASMVIFQWLDPRIRGADADVLAVPIAHSFAPSMWPMGLSFAVIGASISTAYGYHRLATLAQKDRLARQLSQNETLRAELAEQADRLKQNNEQLVKLELANRRTSQFMAHEFKTALGCIGGFAEELLSREGLRRDSTVASALVRIRRQARRMMGTVTDLLDFARIRERGRLRIGAVSAGELLQEAASDFSLPANAGKISLGEHHHRCPPLRADPRLLGRVLCNFISNAVRHNGPHTQVWLDAQALESSGEVLFSCCDDGCGIPPEELESIFTEFASGNETSSTSTGLGLAFCKAVVETHGGRIWCESMPSRGARFFFTIPLPKEHNHDR